jgi:UDP-2,3-diacylglucosamine pyrophosphatase LpxH
MKVNVALDRLVVLGDCHLGNPLFQRQPALLDFLRFQCDQRFNLCINGDLVDILQASLARIGRDVPDVFSRLREFKAKDLEVYYVVGNHDILLEQFLDDWHIFRVTPFLNVTSGSQHIRIEHGHIYDPDFVRSTRVYQFMAVIAGKILALYPKAYRIWQIFEKIRYRTSPSKDCISGENPSYREAAQMIMARGFDKVIFGHSHRAGEVEFDSDRRYVNCGSWLFEMPYVTIIDGVMNLQHWRQ